MQSIIKTKHPAKSLWFMLSMFVISSCLFSTNSYGGKKMELSYLNEKSDFNEPQSLKPQELKLNGGLFSGGYSSISLFPVPQDNSVGTNDMHNAITLISFPKGKIDFEKHFRNAEENIGGGGSKYMPVISKDLIGFAQTRRFMLYNFKIKVHKRFRVAISIAETIEKVAIADARQRQFIFEIEKQNTRSHNPWDTASTLQLMDLSSEEPKLIKEISRKTGITWSVVSDRIFLYDREKEHVQVLNMSLEPAQHPLADAIKQNRGKISFLWIHAHPSLPFAILSGGKYGPVFINWGENKDKTPHLINSSSYQYSFSPDGKWVTFRKKIHDIDAERTYLMPVSEKYPHYLGSPIQIFNKYFDDDNFAWTTNPVSFIGSRGDIIYRWDLINQPHPESKRMSFHDYIVERDLEKLTREKKQGLGK